MFTNKCLIKNLPLIIIPKKSVQNFMQSPLTMQNCKPKFKSFVSKGLFQKKIYQFEKFFVYEFSRASKRLFSTSTYFHKLGKNVYFVYFNFHRLSKCENAKIYETWGNFYGVKRNPIVIWMCQHSNSVFSKAFRVQTLESLIA